MFCQFGVVAMLLKLLSKIAMFLKVLIGPFEKS